MQSFAATAPPVSLAADVKYQWSARNLMMGEGEGAAATSAKQARSCLRTHYPWWRFLDVAIQLPAWQVGAAALRMEMTASDPDRRAPRARTEMGLCDPSAKTLLKRNG